MRLSIAVLGLAFISSGVSATTYDPFQEDINKAFTQIMQTSTGQAICTQILGGDPDMIEFHLGVDHATAEAIATGCSPTATSPWIFPTPKDEVRRTAKNLPHGRKYLLSTSRRHFQIESWTDPKTNTAMILTSSNGSIPHEKLVQLLAHEMAVYFDAKTHPAETVDVNSMARQEIPDLIQGLQVKTDIPTMNPLIAISDPLIAHTLTFTRALQVEFSIIDELLLRRILTIPPDDYHSVALNLIISNRCLETCLETMIGNVRHDAYVRIALPLLALDSIYMNEIKGELHNINSNWSGYDKATSIAVYGIYPSQFAASQLTGNPLLDLQRIYTAPHHSRPQEFILTSQFLDSVMYPIELQAMQHAKNLKGQYLLEFMKEPLLSGNNIQLSSGPRVRVRTGSLE